MSPNLQRLLIAEQLLEARSSRLVWDYVRKMFERVTISSQIKAFKNLLDFQFPHQTMRENKTALLALLNHAAAQIRNSQLSWQYLGLLFALSNLPAQYGHFRSLIATKFDGLASGNNSISVDSFFELLYLEEDSLRISSPSSTALKAGVSLH